MSANQMVSIKTAVLSAGVVLGIVAAFIAGTALSTTGATAEEPADRTVVDHSVNEDGESFGSLAKVESPAEEPDLIRVIATNGKEGYVQRSQLHDVDGSNVANPEEAIKYMKEWENHPEGISIPVYESDGKTVIGEFIVQTPVAVPDDQDG